MRRFDKVHTQGRRSLPKPLMDHLRLWRELDSSMSSDALLMNIFCVPGVVESAAVRRALERGWRWRAGVRLEGTRAFDLQSDSDRTEKWTCA